MKCYQCDTRRSSWGWTWPLTSTFRSEILLTSGWQYALQTHIQHRLQSDMHLPPSSQILMNKKNKFSPTLFHCWISCFTLNCITDVKWVELNVSYHIDFKCMNLRCLGWSFFTVLNIKDKIQLVAIIFSSGVEFSLICHSKSCTHIIFSLFWSFVYPLTFFSSVIPILTINYNIPTLHP